MPAFITFGRILFAVLFIFSGATKLSGSDGDGAIIAGKVVDPGGAGALYGAARNA